VAANAGIVDEDVEALIRDIAHLERACHLARVAHVARHRDGLAAGVPNRIRGRVCQGAVDVRDEQARPDLSQTDGNGATEPGTAASDHGDLTG
jgi:hypothetical protein